MGVGIVSVDDTEFRLLEKLELGSAVICESLMVVEVLVGDVGKDGDLDRNAKSAELAKGMGSGLEDEELGTGVGDGADTLIKNLYAFGGHVF